MRIPVGRSDELRTQLHASERRDAVLRTQGPLKVRADLPERLESKRRLERRVDLAVKRRLRRRDNSISRGPVVEMQLKPRRAGSIGGPVVDLNLERVACHRGCVG